HRGPLAAIATTLAMAWVHDPRKLERALAWLERAPGLARLAAVEPVRGVGFERVGVILARLPPGGPRSAAGGAAVVAALEIDAPKPHVMIEQTRNLEHRLRGRREAPPPAAMRSGPRLIAWIEKLVVRDRHARQRALALIAVTGIAESLAEWQAWE